MKAADTSGPAERKTKLFKSKKELVVLAVCAAVFLVVVLKTYVLKKQDRLAAAEPPPGVSSLVREAQMPAPPARACPDIDALLQAAKDTASDDAAPAEPARDPFTMTGAIRDALREPTSAAKTDQPPSTVVTLTPQNFASVMANIPGAEKAAAKGLVLEAVMASGNWKGAVINGRVCRAGETVLGFELAEVEEDAVVLCRDQHRVRVLLRPTGAQPEGE